MMWIWFGFLSVAFAFVNAICVQSKKIERAVIMAFLSIFSAVLVLLDFMNKYRDWVIRKDWSALEDVLPAASSVLSFCVLCCFLINLYPLAKAVWIEKREA